jgi:hypothetical protein
MTVASWSSAEYFKDRGHTTLSTFDTVLWKTVCEPQQCKVILVCTNILLYLEHILSPEVLFVLSAGKMDSQSSLIQCRIFFHLNVSHLFLSQIKFSSLQFFDLSTTWMSLLQQNLSLTLPNQQGSICCACVCIHVYVMTILALTCLAIP